MSKCISDKEFKDGNFSESPLLKGEYENCNFQNCNFSKADISKISFQDCRFSNCDFTMAEIIKTAFRTVTFVECRLMGLHFEDCNEFLFAVNFVDCQLNLASFYGWKISDTKFKDCNLQEVDFTEADLSNSIFENCELSGAIFENTNLEGADFRSAMNYNLNPEINKISKAKFSNSNLSGLLAKYDIKIE